MIKKVRLKAKEFPALQYTGELKPMKDFLGITDARYDQVTREMIITDNTGALRVVKKGDWVIKDNGPTNPKLAIVPVEEFVEQFDIV